MLRKIVNFFMMDKVDFNELIDKGALILDVRTPDEFSESHIENAINIPVQVLAENLNQLDKSQPIITYCAAGVRSEKAKEILLQNGFEAYNGGGFQTLQSKLK